MSAGDGRGDSEALGRVGEALLGCIAHGGLVAVCSGAGCSAESGIPTFRGAVAGGEGADAPGGDDGDDPAIALPLWSRNDPAALATPEGFARDPELVTRWYDWRRRRCLRASPNAGHRALAELEALCAGADGDGFVLLTQNVDGLHQRAGSVRVHELHGSLYRWRDVATGAERVFADPAPMGVYPPRNDATGNALRPCVVWFGEALPEEVVDAGLEAASRCEVFLSVGTSAAVYPAAGFAEAAGARGAFVAEVNLEATGLSGVADVSVRGRCAELLPRLVSMVRAGLGER
ncbi:MAG: Sir2 family NAD-dependent protein deacetylase [Phycisphaerales bacterium]